jgi:hypothetical protein
MDITAIIVEKKNPNACDFQNILFLSLLVSLFHIWQTGRHRRDHGDQKEEDHGGDRNPVEGNFTEDQQPHKPDDGRPGHGGDEGGELDGFVVFDVHEVAPSSTAAGAV